MTEQDARRAAEMNKIAMDHAANYELDKAEQAYREVIAILDKYKDSENYKEFHKFYMQYTEEMQ